MPRGRKIIKTIEVEECTVGSASEEFYRHNQARGLSEETQRAYKSYFFFVLDKSDLRIHGFSTAFAKHSFT